MKKLVVVTALAAAALAAQSATACDWNREASVETPAVTTAAPPAATAQTAQAAAPQPTNVAAQDTARKPVDPSAPMVLVNDKQ